MDRRKRKTRTAILNACIQLIQEKEFASITINEIVQRADINRGTFYLHFEDKLDMMSSFENEMIEKIKEVFVTNLPEEQSNELFIASRYQTIVQLLTCFEKDKELLQFILKSSHHQSFQMKFRRMLEQLLKETVFPKLHHLQINIPIDLFVIIFISNALSLAEYTYQSEEPIDVEQLATFLINIMINGPAKTLGIM